MRKIIVYCLFFVNLACNTDTVVRTKENYEAVLLPDGSQVYMNHHSTLSYQQDFDPRTVTLSGEAFFTVTPGESLYTVATAHGDIRVLGTEFNVRTASDKMVVDVHQGMVELKTEFDKSKVKKGIKAVYRNGEQAVQKIKSDKEYRKWILAMEKDFKALGKELKPILKKIGNDFKKAGKKMGEGFKN